MKFKNIRAPYAFLGAQNDYDESDVVVLPVPYDSTTSYRCGAREGPQAIITASRQIEYYDIELGKEIANGLKIHTANELEPDTNSPSGTIKRIEEAVKEIVNDKKFPIMLGGEHSISVGAVSALKSRYEDLSVLQIDAHADLRDTYEGSKYNHACVMKRIREKVSKVSQVGIRSYSAEEAEYIEKNGLWASIHGNDPTEDELLSSLSNNVYITVDLDGFDPAEVPAVGTPEPGGLRWADGLRILRKVAEKRKIVGFDITELAPIPGNIVSDFFAAKLCYKLLGYSFLR